MITEYLVFEEFFHFGVWRGCAMKNPEPIGICQEDQPSAIIERDRRNSGNLL
jgi:hypothetical protein